MRSRTCVASLLPCAALAAAVSFGALAAANPIDPGVRTAPTDNGPPVPLPGLGVDELTFFDDGLVRFNTVEVVSGALPNQGNGLGPRFNSTSCGSCHSQPYVGGSSPAQNPLLTIATADGATNEIPWFITKHGPIREALFVESNGVADGGGRGGATDGRRNGSARRASGDGALPLLL